MNKKYAYVMLFVVSIVWGGGFIATSAALDTFAPFTILAIRFLCSSILASIVCFPTWKTWKNQNIWVCIKAGIILAVAFAFQTIALETTTTSNNAFLTATNVIFVPFLLGILYKQTLKNKQWFISILCIIGIGLLTLKNGFSNVTIGDFYSLVGAVFFALHMIYIEKHHKQIDVIPFMCIQIFTAGILSLVGAILFETFPINISSSAINSMVFLTLGSTLFAYGSQIFAQTKVSASSTAMILSLESVWACIFSIIFLKEQLNGSMIIGICLILTAIFLQEKQ